MIYSTEQVDVLPCLYDLFYRTSRCIALFVWSILQNK